MAGSGHNSPRVNTTPTSRSGSASPSPPTFPPSRRRRRWGCRLPLEQDEETPIGPSLTVRARRVAHGTRPSTPCAFPTPPDVPEVPYESTAFFITSSPSSATQEGGVGRGREGSKQFLFFGDVGPDSVSGLDWNRRVWGEAAALLSQGVLDTVFIECSYPVRLASHRVVVVEKGKLTGQTGRRRGRRRCCTDTSRPPSCSRNSPSSHPCVPRRNRPGSQTVKRRSSVDSKAFRVRPVPSRTRWRLMSGRKSS